ncbi:MAG: alpha/beta fold hydrolase [Anaerolineales bacterium]|jgi:pimeloyl-ACP methyl ester carboxylesterase
MQINNHQLHIKSHGPEHGHTVVLLHDGLGSTRSWRRQVPALAQAGYRVILYDRWGYGQSEARPYLEVPSFRDDLADLESILSTLQIGSTSLIGHSDGGTIALYFAAQHPEQVTSLVTIAAHIYLEPKMESGVKKIRQTFEMNENFRAKFRGVHGDKFEAVFHNWFDGWHTPKTLDWDMRSLLPKILCPTLVIQGEKDEHATRQHAQDIADGIIGSELWIASGAAHMLPLEIPKLLNKKLVMFLGATTCPTKKQTSQLAQDH